MLDSNFGVHDRQWVFLEGYADDAFVGVDGFTVYVEAEWGSIFNSGFLSSGICA
jgi:hypothetical protein